MVKEERNKDPQEESLMLLRRIDGRLDAMDGKLDQVQKTAVRYGAAAGGIAGGVVSLGIAFAKSKLGL